MSSNFEKSVKGGTKVKLAPPKSKYVEHILLATQSGDAAVAEVFRTLIHRLRDSTWTVAFKSLIIVHLMIKEGAPGTTLRYLAVAPQNRLAVNSFTDVQTQGQNIRRYSEYLLARAQAYAATKCDYVRSGNGRMKPLTVDKGLLRETQIVQDQIRALVRCDLLSNDVENEISLTAFRLLTTDLLTLYNVENEAVMTVLSRYFEMSRPDAERAIQIYKAFCKQTDQVVQFLGVARQYEHATRLEIPKLKHAPTSLVSSLQEYLDDKDFEVNRRQYLAEQEGKRTGKPVQRVAPAKTQPSNPTVSAPAQQAQPAAPTAAPQQSKGRAPDLIDFFDSIEQNQQPMAQGNQQFAQQPTGFPLQGQQTGFPPQQQQQQPPQAFGFQQQPQPTGFDGFAANNVSTNPFGQPQQFQQQQPPQQPQPQPQQPPPQPLQTQFTGAGFGGYGPQPQQQQQQQQQQQFATGNGFTPAPVQSPVQMQPSQGLPQQQGFQPQPTGSTNPFRQSSMPTAGAGSPDFGIQQGLQRQSTNPFARNVQAPTATGNAYAPQPPQPSPFSQQQQPPHIVQAQPTGTNPFARNIATPQQQPTPPMSPPNALQVQPTGSTNPFRQSAFVNQQTGQGWQNAPQVSMGGLEHLETIPVFPRPGQVTGQQQQQQPSPWG
ncbi:hypothetical protein B0A55_04427 [Friedmanniomyces simplex]|uniref:ENTH domain-containing protein n=1 Tax=Friedmanniomyces simplex TaxID=329884 RepID=A0A4U0XL46_9PEZI|nr:hypothetical protein B0A55_04427 [Friedmanniomyces simplex]